MNHMITNLFLLINGFTRIFSMDDLCNNNLSVNTADVSEEYIPLRYSIIKSFISTNPCDTDKSILIQQNFLYRLDREQLQWKRLCVSRIFFTNQIPIVTSIAHLENDIILIINQVLFRTQGIISSLLNNDIIYQLTRYSNIEKIDYVFTTPCCACHKTDISYAFNEYVILANKDGNVILFYFKSMTIVYEFDNIFQSQSVCQSNQCTILYIGISQSVPILMCVIKYQTEKALIFHQSFLDFNSTFSKSINFIGENLYITPSTFPNAYFIWDRVNLFYTSNGGLVLSEVIINGCQSNMNEYQLREYYNNLNIDYDNITLVTNEMYCLNQTIDYIFISNKEFFLMTEKNEWLYGKESLIPSMWYLFMVDVKQKNECGPIVNIPKNFEFVQGSQKLLKSSGEWNRSQCLVDINKQSLPCSPYIQSFCSYLRFEPLFDINQIYILEKNRRQSFSFILHAYTIIPIIISSTKSTLLNYSINYTIDRLNNGIVQIIGNILILTTNQTSDDLYGSSLISLRLDLVQHGYSCNQSPSFSFQIEASCSLDSTFRVKKNVEFEYWNQSNSISDIEWIRQNLPINAIDQFSPVYIKRKQIELILLNYQYCFNRTCHLIPNDQLDSLLIYAIAINKEHEHYAHYLINRSDSCVPISRSIYRLWLKWTLNMTTRSQLFQVPYERRTFYRTLLQTLSIPNNSCLFFNGSNSIHINESLNQASDNHLKFILHIIAYKNKFSFCDLETFILIEIEPTDTIHNPYRGFVFLIILFIFILFFILFINIYIYYKRRQNQKHLEYRRLNQIDAGQLHQWYDIARFLNENKNTENYDSIRNHLMNTQPTTSLTNRLMEYHT